MSKHIDEKQLHAAWICHVLHEHDLTQRSLAKLIKAEESKVSLVKSGQRTLNSSEWRRLANLACVSYDEYWHEAPL